MASGAPLEPSVVLAAAPTSWNVDPGGAFDISRSSELDTARTRLAKLVAPTPLVTTGGDVGAGALHQVRVFEAGIGCDALVLKTLSVESLGKHWCVGELPVLVSPIGDDVIPELRHDAPIADFAQTFPVGARTLLTHDWTRDGGRGWRGTSVLARNFCLGGEGLVGSRHTIGDMDGHPIGGNAVPCGVRVCCVCSHHSA